MPNWNDAQDVLRWVKEQEDKGKKVQGPQPKPDDWRPTITGTQSGPYLAAAGSWRGDNGSAPTWKTPEVERALEARALLERETQRVLNEPDRPSTSRPSTSTSDRVRDNEIRDRQQAVSNVQLPWAPQQVTDVLQRPSTQYTPQVERQSPIASSPTQTIDVSNLNLRTAQGPQPKPKYYDAPIGDWGGTKYYEDQPAPEEFIRNNPALMYTYDKMQLSEAARREGDYMGMLGYGTSFLGIPFTAMFDTPYLTYRTANGEDIKITAGQKVGATGEAIGAFVNEAVDALRTGKPFDAADAERRATLKAYTDMENVTRQLAELTPEQRSIASAALRTGYSGNLAVSKAMQEIQDKGRTQEIRQQAQALADQGKTNEAQQLWQYANELDGKTYSDIADENQNIAVDLAMSLYFDPLDWILTPVTGAMAAADTARKARKLLEAYDLADVTKLDNLTKEAAQLAGKIEAGQAVDARNWLQRLVGKTGQTEASQAAQGAYKSATQILSGVDNVEDAKTLVATWIDTPAALLTGVQGLSPTYTAKVGPGTFGAATVLSDEALQALPVMKVARNQILDLPALKADGSFSLNEFLNQMFPVIERTAQQAYGATKLQELPGGAAKFALRKMDADRWIVEYMSDGGNVLATSKAMPFAEAQQFQQNLIKSTQTGAAEKAGQAWRGAQSALTGFMVDNFMNSNPAHWIRNMIGAGTPMITDDIYTLKPTTAVTSEIAQAGGGVAPTRRLQEALAGTGGEFTLGGGSLTAEGENWTRRFWKKNNPYAAVNEAGGKVWTGTTHIPGTPIPLGEQANYMRAFNAAYGKVQRPLWESAVGKTVSQWAASNGIDPNVAATLANKIVSASATGASKAEVANVAQATAQAATLPIDLRAIGIPDELLSADAWKALENGLGAVFAGQAGTGNMLEDAAALVNKVIDDEKLFPAHVLRTIAPDPTVAEWSKAAKLDEGVEIADELTASAMQAGMNATQAQTEARKTVEALTAAEAEATNAFLEAAKAAPAAPVTTDITFDMMSSVYELKRTARAEVDALTQWAIEQGNDTAWAVKFRKTNEIYTKLAADTQALIGSYTDELARLAAGEANAARPVKSWWDTLRRYIEYDASELADIRSQKLGGTVQDAPEVFGRVLEANLRFVDASFVRLFDAFRRFPSDDALDILRAAQKNVDTEGARAAAYFAELRQLMLNDKLSLDEYRAITNAGWNKVFDNQAIFNEAAMRAIVANAAGQAVPTGLRWTNDAGDALLLLGQKADGTWLAHNTKTGKAIGVAQDAIPADVLADFQTASQQAIRTQEELAAIKAATPLPEAPGKTVLEAIDPANDVQFTNGKVRPDIPSVGKVPLQPGEKVVTKKGETGFVVSSSPNGSYVVEIGGKNRRYKGQNLFRTEAPPAAQAQPIGAVLQSQNGAPAAKVQASATQAQPTVTGKQGVTGPTTTAWSDPANPYEFQYEVIDLGDLIPSNLPDGRVNPAYPKELQPRDRTQAASQLQINRIAKNLSPNELLADTTAIDRGAPIINGANVVESGNGRIAALGLADTELYGPYRLELYKRAQELGIDTAALDAMDRPVLVRRRVSEVDPIAFAQEANARVTLGMNTAEQGKVLAGNLTAGELSKLDMAAAPRLSEALASPRNADFVSSVFKQVPASEAALYANANGQLTQQGVELIRSALFHIVIGDNRALIDNFILNPTPELANVANGVERAVAKLAQLQATNPDLALRDELGEAVARYLDIRRRGVSVETELNQLGMFNNLSPEVQTLIRTLDENKNSGRAIGDFLNHYADEALKHAPGTEALFAEAAPNKANMLQTAADWVRTQGQDSLFTQFDSAIPRFKMPSGAADGWLTDDPKETFRNLYNMLVRGGNKNAADAGNLAQYMVGTLDEARDRILANLGNLAQVKPNTMTPQQAQAVQQLIAQLMPQYDNINRAAINTAEGMANFAMLDYTNRRGFDTMLGMVAPFHYFWTRGALRNWTIRMAQKPQIPLRVGKINTAIERENEQAQVPMRLEGSIPIPGTDIRLGNPLRWFIPEVRNDYVDTDGAVNQAEQTFRMIQQWMPGMMPPLQYAIEAGFDTVAPRPDGTARTQGFFTPRRWVPLYGTAGDIAQATTGQRLPYSGDNFNEYRVRRAASVLLAEGAQGFNEDGVQYAQQLSYNIEQNRDRYQGIPEAKRKDAERIYLAASKRVGEDHSVTSVGRLGTGMNLYRYPQGEQDLRQAQRDYGAAGWDAVDNPFGSNAARSEVRTQNPALPTYWSRNVNPGDLEPAQAAQLSEMYGRLDAEVYGPMAEAVTAALLNDPYMKNAELNAVKSPFWDKEDEIKGQYDIPKKEKGIPSGANPMERAIYELEQMLRVDGKPQRPADDATPEQMQEYYAEKAAWEEQRLDTLDTRFNKVLSDVTPRAANGQKRGNLAPDWKLALASLVEGQYSSELLRKYSDLKHANDVEKQWSDRTAPVSEQSDMAYREAENLFGRDVIDSLDTKPDWPGDDADKATTDAYKAQLNEWRKANPYADEANLWLYGLGDKPNKGDIPEGKYLPLNAGKDHTEAINIFGPDIFEIEREKNAAPDWDVWKRANPEKAQLLYGYWNWREEMMKRTIEPVPFESAKTTGYGRDPIGGAAPITSMPTAPATQPTGGVTPPASGAVPQSPVKGLQPMTAAEWAAMGGGGGAGNPRVATVGRAFGPETGSAYQQYLALPPDSQARRDFKAANPELRAVSLYVFEPELYNSMVKQFGQKAVMEWAFTPAYGDDPIQQQVRKGYLEQTPGAFMVQSWLNGRPQPFNEADTANDEAFRYDAGVDFAQAKQLFGDDIWTSVTQYRAMSSGERGSYQDRARVMSFYDWWYGLLPDTGNGRPFVASSGARRGYSGGGGGGYSGGGWSPNRYPADIRTRGMDSNLWQTYQTPWRASDLGVRDTRKRPSNRPDLWSWRKK